MIGFTTNDVIDNYAHKNFALFGLPLIMAIVQAICLIAINTKLNKLKNEEKPKILKIMEWFIPVVSVLFYVIMVEVPCRCEDITSVIISSSSTIKILYFISMTPIIF